MKYIKLFENFSEEGSLEKIPYSIVVKINKYKFQKENCPSINGRNEIYHWHNNWMNCDEEITLLDGKYYPLYVYKMGESKYHDHLPNSDKDTLYEWVFISFDSGKNVPGSKPEIKINFWNDHYQLTDSKLKATANSKWDNSSIIASMGGGVGLPFLFDNDKEFRFFNDFNDKYRAVYFEINKPIFCNTIYSHFSRLEKGEKDDRNYCEIIDVKY